MKADTVNRLITDYCIDSVLELGCGDGYQASLLNVHRYTGLDIAPRAVRLCVDRFQNDDTKSFVLYSPNVPMPRVAVPQADMTLSLDVIFHLVEQVTFERYMMDLFRLARRVVVIYSTNGESAQHKPKYTRRRVFTDWIRDDAPAWRLAAEYPSPYPDLSLCSFYIYTRASDGP